MLLGSTQPLPLVLLPPSLLLLLSFTLQLAELTDMHRVDVGASLSSQLVDTVTLGADALMWREVAAPVTGDRLGAVPSRLL